MITGIVAGSPVVAGPPPGPWTPSDITTELWLDASDAGTITESGGLVSQWNDKSGNERHASQSSDAVKPAVIAAAQNGLDVIRYTNDQLNFSGFPQLSGQNIFLAGNTASLGASWRLFMNRDNSSAPALYIGTSAADYRPSVFWTGASSIFGSAIQRAALFRWSFAQGSPASTLTQIDAGTPVTGTIAAATLGNWITLGLSAVQQLVMDKFEIVMLPPGASTDTIDRVHGYLAWKWGLEANLPVDHPYKDSPP